MTVLASSSGYVLYEEGSRVILADQHTRGLAIAIFVVGLISLICAANAVIFGVLAMTAALILAPIALAGVVILHVLMLRYKKITATPPHELATVVIFDTGRGALLDHNGKELAPLATVRVVKRFQLGSSSPALAAQYKNGSILLVSGNPFLGGLGALPEIFRSRGWVD